MIPPFVPKGHALLERAVKAETAATVRGAQLELLRQLLIRCEARGCHLPGCLVAAALRRPEATP